MPPRLLAFAVFATLLLWPAHASAGTYDVYSCRLPDGTPAPTDGWHPFVDAGRQSGLRAGRVRTSEAHCW